MDMLESIRINLASPAILFFVLGIVTAVVKSDLRFPEPLYLGLAIYLLVAIGFKGGVAVSAAGLGAVWLPALAAMALGALIPLWTYPILRWVGLAPEVIEGRSLHLRRVRIAASPTKSQCSGWCRPWWQRVSRLPPRSIPECQSPPAARGFHLSG